MRFGGLAGAGHIAERRPEPRCAALLWAALALAASAGAVTAEGANAGVPAVAPQVAAQVKSLGADLYRSRCARCHGKTGEGQRHSHDAAPRLAGKTRRLTVDRIAVLMLRGGSYMPRFDDLTDADVAAVATYLRAEFGGATGVVTETEIAGFRQEVPRRPD